MIVLAPIPVDSRGTRRRHHARLSQILDRRTLSVQGQTRFRPSPLRKYLAIHDGEVSKTIYRLYKEKLTTKPTPTAKVAKSMHYPLSRSSPEVSGVNPEGFVEARKEFNRRERKGRKTFVDHLTTDNPAGRSHNLRRRLSHEKHETQNSSCRKFSCSSYYYAFKFSPLFLEIRARAKTPR